MINFTEAASPIKLPNEYSVVPAVAGSVGGLKLPERRPVLNDVIPSVDDVLYDERQWLKDAKQLLPGDEEYDEKTFLM